jgi:hypothetical protein
VPAVVLAVLAVVVVPVCLHTSALNANHGALLWRRDAESRRFNHDDTTSTTKEKEGLTA